MSGSLLSVPGTQSHWCPFESLGATHFSIAPARGKRAGYLSTNSCPSLIEGCLGILTPWYFCRALHAWTFQGILMQPEKALRQKQILDGKISVCMGTSCDAAGDLQGGPRGCGSARSIYYRHVVRCWVAEGQLEAGEWLRLIQGEFSGKVQLQRIKCFPDGYNLIVWSVFAMDNWVFL